jgi:hypothetical protein
MERLRATLRRQKNTTRSFVFQHADLGIVKTKIPNLSGRPVIIKNAPTASRSLCVDPPSWSPSGGVSATTVLPTLYPITGLRRKADISLPR